MTGGIERVLRGDETVLEIELSPPRIIKIHGLTKTGKHKEWHLKVTENQKLAIL